MYSRNYFTGGADITLPENYDGTAFSDVSSGDEEVKAPKIEAVKNEVKFSPKSDTNTRECTEPDEVCEECGTKEKSERGLFGMKFGGSLSSLFSGARPFSFLPNEFGVEEILIIGIALFLLFSPEHDIECALLILALIFIK